MRSTLIANVAILMSSAAAGFVRGPCRNSTSLPYDASTMSTSLAHYLLYMDKSVYSYLGVAS